jgi:tRNA(Ile)-lysidine synthase
LRRNLRNLNFEHIEQAIAIIESGVTGSQATLPQGLKLTLSYRTFTITPEYAQPDFARFDFPYLLTEQPLPLNLPGVTLLPHSDWQLRATLLTGPDVTSLQLRQVDRWEAYLDAEVVGHQAILRPRQPGDTFCPLGLAGHRQKVADFMINEKIPANQRDLVPLLVANEQVLWLCGYRPDERARIQPDTRQIVHLKFEAR